MNGQELFDILRSVNHVIRKSVGIFTMESFLQTRISGESMVVIHIHNHWVCLYIPRNFEFPVEYFDPLGCPPPDSLSAMITSGGYRYEYNSKAIQGPVSVSCGSFCIMYVVLRLGGISITDIVRIFTKSYEINDNLVLAFVEMIGRGMA